MTDRSRPLLAAQALIASLLILAGLGTASAAAEKRIQFNIVAQDLASALNEFARQSAQELLFSTDIAAAKRTSGVVGEFAPTEALRALLQGTGLRYRINDDKTILIEKGDLESARRAGMPASAFMTPMMAQTMPAFRAAQDPEGDAQESSAEPTSDENAARLGEMVVTTGSHIPGGETGSPVMVFDRAAIDSTGAATAQQFLATLPQNFGGGRSDDSGVLPGVLNDDVFGSTVNLRGLGSGTTLVLVNGRRLALAGDLEYVDISMIPLSAVERIEVLTDGASALYGADAIGGVVNFVMRKQYSGAETRLRGGWTGDGGGKERQVAQTLGASWTSGHALLSYEYYDREAVTALQRESTQNLALDNSIIPPQTRHGVIVSAEQDIASGVSLFVDGLYSERRADNEIFQDETATDANGTESENEQYGGALGMRYAFGRTWHSEIAVGINRDFNDSRSFSPLFPGEDTFGTRESEMRYADLSLTGDLFNLPAGPVKLAWGAGYREDSYTQVIEQPIFDLVVPLTSDEFDVKAAFAEVQLPLLGVEGDATRSRLTLSLAGRYEEYSNFGNTFNPKYGITFMPIDALRLRATYGTSFKAPTLIQNDTTGNAIFATNVATPSGPVRSIRLAGRNAELDPETATTWTTGFDLNLRTFDAHVTYFDIEYDDRIESVGVAQLEQLTDATYAGTRIRRGDVSDAEFDALIASILSNPDNFTFFGCVGMPPSRNPCSEPATNFNAVLDRRLLNLATSKDSGLDVTMNQRFDTQAGVFDLGLNAVYYFDFVRQFTEDAPAADLVDTIYLPTDFRVRASLGFTRDAWSLRSWINHTDNYTDNGVSPAEEVRSWTTLDLNFTYDAGKRSNSWWLEDTRFVINVTNAFDKRPPFVDRTDAIQYDPANADPVGRVLSISFNRGW